MTAQMEYSVPQFLYRQSSAIINLALSHWTEGTQPAHKGNAALIFYSPCACLNAQKKTGETFGQVCSRYVLLVDSFFYCHHFLIDGRGITFQWPIPSDCNYTHQFMFSSVKVGSSQISLHQNEASFFLSIYDFIAWWLQSYVSAEKDATTTVKMKSKFKA